jgi:hypothetical protein
MSTSPVVVGDLRGSGCKGFRGGGGPASFGELGTELLNTSDRRWAIRAAGGDRCKTIHCYVD